MIKPKPNTHPKTIILISFFLSIPIFLIAQETLQSVVEQNTFVEEYIAMLGPMAVSPFWTLFITSFFSTFELNVGDSMVATNPLLGSEAVLGISFLLVLITTLPNMMKMSKPIGLAGRFLEDRAGFVIYGVTAIAPHLMNPEMGPLGQVETFGLFGIPNSIILLVILALPYFMIVTSVRYFLEILVFLSPIPLLDAFFELVKNGATLGFVVLFFLAPWVGVFLSILLFFVSLLFFNRARRVTNLFKYVFVQPILFRLIGRKRALVSERLPRGIEKRLANITLAVKCLTGKKGLGLPSKRPIWLVQSDHNLYLCRAKWLRTPSIIALDESIAYSLTIGRDLNYYCIQSADAEVKLLINKTYRDLYADIAAQLSLQDLGNVGLARQKDDLMAKGRSGMQSLFGMFSAKSISESRKNILGE